MKLELRVPTLNEHRSLAESVGWSEAFDWGTLQGSLDASLAGVVVTQSHVVIGMGRLVGDGVKYFYVQDVAVHPDHQGHGIGRTIMDELLAFVERTAPSTAFVGLFSSNEGEKLYREVGFAGSDLTGMTRLIVPGSRTLAES